MSVKVSIVTPCYNGAPFIKKYMQSILELDYDNLELIIINDGSTDNSLQILNSYKKTIEERGIVYQVVDKDNGGQPSAFNAGIKLASGKYVVWPDIDDHMHTDFISKKVSYMEMHKEIDFLLTKSAIVELKKPDVIRAYTWPKKITDNKELVNRILEDREIWYEPGAFMARMESFDRLIKERHIYDECGVWSGPQTQIIMPFFYYANIGYLNECLYDYYIHDKQDHKKIKDIDKLKYKSVEVKKMLSETVKALNAKDERYMIERINVRMLRYETIIAFQNDEKKWFFEAYSKLDRRDIKTKDIMRYIIMRYFVVKKIYEIYKMIFQKKKVL